MTFANAPVPSFGQARDSTVFLTNLEVTPLPIDKICTQMLDEIQGFNFAP